MVLQSTELSNTIFNIHSNNFLENANKIFQLQFQKNKVYKEWVNSIKSNFIFSTFELNQIPFLPISFFKTHQVIVDELKLNSIVFESSGTTTTINSKHYVSDIEIYKKSFINAFQLNYGNIDEYCIIGLLPSYLERNNSSLVFMVDELIKESNNKNSGFYLYNFSELNKLLKTLDKTNTKIIIFGVTFALLDFAEAFPQNLKNTIIIETGGMKGRKKEMTKTEVQDLLKAHFGLNEIHSEYGMTELLSQAYSTQNQIHFCPPWMKVLVRKEDDPFDISLVGKGVLNIIDLANINSCSFIATDDVGEVFEDGSFKVYGRLDNSDLRGCSLLFA